MSQMNNGIRGFVAAATIAQYSQIKIDTAGKAAIAGAGDVTDGIAEIAASSGQEVSVRMHNHAGTRKVIMAGACSIGDLLYTAASGQLSTTPASGPAVFKALEAATASGDIIEAIPVDLVIGGSSLLGANVNPSTGISNTTTETAFDKKVTIPAGSLQVGDVLDIEASVLADHTHSTDTLNLKLYLGGLSGPQLCATGALDVADNDQGKLRAKVIVQAAGVSGKVAASGETAIGTPGSVDEKTFILPQTSIDTTAALDVQVSATWSVASSSNDAILETLSVIRHRA